MKTKILLSILVLALAGCSSLKDHIFVTTGTYLGVEVAENPSTQLYEAKLGYGRGEFAFVPVNTNGPVPDVIMEIRIQNIFQGGGIYQRLCVGSNAVGQPGATVLFSKDAKGNIITNAADSLMKFQMMRPAKPQ